MTTLSPSPLLTIPATRPERETVLNNLILTWYPKISRSGVSDSELLLAESELGFRLPSSLRHWYQTSGTRNDIWSRQDIFLPPDKLTCHEDRLVFFIENQGVVRWGIPVDQLSDDDPLVELKSADTGEPWVKQSSSVSQFAIEMFAYTLMFGEAGDWVYGYAQPALVTQIKSVFPRLSFPVNWWTGTQLFGYHDLVIAVDSGDFVHASALTDDALDAFASLVTPELFDRYTSSRDP